MGKQEIKQRETQLATGNGMGKQEEQTYTVDDNCLPSPQELASYKEIDPKIVDYLLSSSIKEQEHRHDVDVKKLEIIKRSEDKQSMMNWWGMFFAFLSIIVLSSLAAYALYLDKPWFAGIIGAGAFVSIASIFVRKSSGEDIPPNKGQK